jgi:hypothetical protein
VLAAPATARADWVAAAFLGHHWIHASTVVVNLPERQAPLEIDNVTYRAESFTSPQYYGYRITWIPVSRHWLGVEAEFIHAKVFAKLPSSAVVQRLAMSHGLNFILANVAVRRDLGSPDVTGTTRIVAVLRAGVGPTLPHAESTVGGVTREQYEGGGLGLQAGGGVEMRMWRGLGALGEYKFTWATPRIGVAGGEATVPVRSHHLVGGVALRF